jgi:hypothetical protein
MASRSPRRTDVRPLGSKGSRVGLAAPEAESGDRTFVGTDIDVGDFWSWALGDLAMNVNRSLLAEYLVARAVGNARAYREEWAAFDVLTQDGIRIEVKSSAYLQRWSQARPSAIPDEPSIRCDVFVFAVQTCQDPTLYDPYDVGQREFYVVLAETVRLYRARSTGLAWLRRITSPVTYDRLADTVAEIGGTT